MAMPGPIDDWDISTGAMFPFCKMLIALGKSAFNALINSRRVAGDFTQKVSTNYNYA